jgi:hypothetical protein
MFRRLLGNNLPWTLHKNHQCVPARRYKILKTKIKRGRMVSTIIINSFTKKVTLITVHLRIKTAMLQKQKFIISAM